MSNKKRVNTTEQQPDPDLLTMPDAMTDRIVRNSQEHIHQLEQAKADFQPQYDKDKQFYEEAKAIFDKSQEKMTAIDTEIAEENHVIEMVRRFKHADPNSRKNQKRAEATRGNRYDMDWLAEAEAVLRDRYQFMDALSIYEAIVAKPEIYERVKDASSFKNNKMRWSFRKIATDHAKQVTQGKPRSGKFIPTLYWYKNAIGLPEWMDKDGLPTDAKLMQSLMFAATKPPEKV